MAEKFGTMKTALIIALAALTGCTVVPSTKVAFNPLTRELSIRSPKDISISNLVATIGTNGTATISIGSYSSHNNAEVISAVANLNAQTMKTTAELGGQVLGTMIKTAK